MLHTLHPIGTVQSPYAQKFGIPRQPQLVPAAETIITLNPEFTADSVRGLDGFDYIWLQFLFHDAISEGWAQMIRPPRLGGKQKMGRIRHPQPAPPQPHRAFPAAPYPHRHHRQPRAHPLPRRRPAQRHAHSRHQTLYPLCRSPSPSPRRLCERRARAVNRDLAA